MMSKSTRDAQEKPTSSGRPRLSLPSLKPQLGLAGAGGLPPSGTLSKSYHTKILAELARILGVAVEALPGGLCGRVPVPLKIGIHGDLAARYPLARSCDAKADADALRHWLRRWTNTDAYLVAVAAGGSRFDLDGAQCGEIMEKEAAHARDRLARKRKS